jgi:hypothetical protein
MDTATTATPTMEIVRCLTADFAFFAISYLQNAPIVGYDALFDAEGAIRRDRLSALERKSCCRSDFAYLPRMPDRMHDDQQQALVTGDLSAKRMWNGARTKVRRAGFDKPNRRLTRLLECCYGFRKRTESARGPRSFGRFNPPRPVRALGENLRFELANAGPVCRRCLPESRQESSLGCGDVFGAIQNRPAVQRRPRPCLLFGNSRDCFQELSPALLKPLDEEFPVGLVHDLLLSQLTA